jgi:hypothetical protein
MEEAEMAPMYFQKAFQDAEGLWATNKAVINTMKEMSHFKKVPHQLGTIDCKKLISNTIIKGISRLNLAVVVALLILSKIASDSHLISCAKFSAAWLISTPESGENRGSMKKPK